MWRPQTSVGDAAEANGERQHTSLRIHIKSAIAAPAGAAGTFSKCTSSCKPGLAVYPAQWPSEVSDTELMPRYDVALGEFVSCRKPEPSVLTVQTLDAEPGTPLDEKDDPKTTLLPEPAIAGGMIGP